MIAARSRGIAAIAVPGDRAWQHGWAQLLARRHVAVIMDCDLPGRSAAARIAGDLHHIADPYVIDLASGRADGYDLTDWQIENPFPSPRLAELLNELRSR